MILDCTFRDGGYYTDWYFDRQIVLRYLQRMTADVIEIGFRSVPGTSGPFRYCTEEFLASLDIPDDMTIAAMVDFKDWDRTLFKRDSRIDMVRVATHLEDLPRVRPALGYLKDLGYRTALNVMQVNRASDELLRSLVFGPELDVLYFADSFGGMTPKDIEHVCQSLNHPQIGFHGHQNRGLAFQNCVAAKRCGGDLVRRDRGWHGAGRRKCRYQ